MKKLLAITVAVAILAMAGAALAADTNTLTVTASVTGTCKFESGASTLDFGALDPSSTLNPSASNTTRFWCTKGVTGEAITAGNGANGGNGTVNNMKHATLADLIPYTLTLTKDGSANAGPGSPRTLTIGGSITNADYINQSAGAYSDTVVLTLTP